MIQGVPHDRRSRPTTTRPTARAAVRRAARAGGLAAALLAIMAIVDHRAGPAAPGLAAAVAVLPLALVPVAVRLLAHPGEAALPPRSCRTAMHGLAIALAAVAAGLASTVVAGRAGAGLLHLGLTIATLLAALAATVTLVPLYAGRTADRPDGARPPSAVSARPDFFDDLALLSARAFPGSPTARGLARLNRGFDRWSWSPRRRTVRAVVRPLRPQPE